ncbi:envelope glycoprotein K [Psittacid alphaherpesvirus 5]|uniref:Envelope glycoprotein K n=1 Tax=Psittacid alphaherpesvirus 5 TaxID=2972693 RepID=A0A5P9JQW6_9ALPH|nr:envelope glycoprotein K [Psittacid alphaherpesvirus 5]QFU14551.1 envelope glycoprotein K [Psittacid alphaherpesvirus 5]UOO01022.1 envelope glycoprotein K [Psittacid alphaherpesvirus 5]
MRCESYSNSIRDSTYGRDRGRIVIVIPILTFITANILTAYLSMLESDRGNKILCVYKTGRISSVVPLIQSNDTLLEAFNGSFIYIMSVNDSLSERCTQNFLKNRELNMALRMDPKRERIRYVYGSQDCIDYIQTDHIPKTMTAGLIYVLFLNLRRQRFLFGIYAVRDNNYHAAVFPLSYFIAIFARVVVRVRYTKFSLFTQSMSYYRHLICNAFVEDPVGVMAARLLGAFLIALEYGIHFMGLYHICLLIRLPLSWCAITVPLYLKLIIWFYAVIVYVVEIYFIFDTRASRVRDDESDQVSETKQKSTITRMMMMCCVATVSNVIARAGYTLTIILVILMILKYEGLL